MDKAEELIKNLEVYIKTLDITKQAGIIRLIQRTIIQLKKQDEYAQQVSRERDKWVAIEFATTYFTLGISREDVYRYFNEWYDEWIKNQQ